MREAQELADTLEENLDRLGLGAPNTVPGGSWKSSPSRSTTPPNTA